MKYNTEWKDYSVIATGDGYKLERWKDVYLLRPDPQVIWPMQKDLYTYKNLNAIYKRESTGGGYWQVLKSYKPEWVVSWRNLKFKIKPMGFKHTGLFPEQAVNWDLMINLIKQANRPIKVLNLFAYTGGATIACASAGASVTHVDAAAGMVERAKENAKLSGLENAKIRYIVDDCEKFVKREIRRQNFYDAIVMDPPSYGRGPNGEMWKLEENIFNFVSLCAGVLSEKPLFVLINSYTTGLQPTVMENILKLALKTDRDVSADEIGLKTEENVILPCGCSAIKIYK